ncbi:type I polyketide synthase [Paraliomyxa miuraensis]|uniref:type I polyketide synthase n=1 Tax=Paraliomyxa miuraensis TaxID=376150 RepID=UPI00224DEE6A|nr:type I polyketide synthase [Paraliomyxa miuraensis]MCX4246642.1 SDR family NAD(P)-dependent oxidoreductase [Paraliomyxa miuraensis]
MSTPPRKPTEAGAHDDGRSEDERGNALSSLHELRTTILSHLAARVGREAATLDPSERFVHLGLDSIAATAMLEALGRALGRTLLPTLAWEHPTPEALARHLAGMSFDETAATRRSKAEEPIVLVGMACRFPGAESLEAYWQLLRGGVDAIGEVPEERWEADAFYDPDPAAPGMMNTRWGGFLTDIAGFDPGFFGISPREAKQMDPQQRLALELAWEALEDAGIAPERLRGSRCGVFFGAMWSDYERLIAGSAEAIVQHTATGQNLSIVPARVSHALGLMGPSMVVNTACSSSLVAVHLAAHSLRRGESDLCVVGGVNLMISPESSIAMSKFGGLSPDGRSKAFDARANGYVRGEGGGVVVLERLSDALARRDRIYCVLRGSAVNNDGFSNGLTAPNPQAQRELLWDACANAGVEPSEIQFVEAHGTGTMLGDPIEAGALGAVLGKDRPVERALRVGSVKTNIGHLESAAGVAGLIKVALSMQKGELPASLHFETPNPHIPFDALKLQVQTECTPWKGEQGRLLAGVSSFGFGGTNCHLVLEGHDRSRSERVVFVFGGHGSQWRGMGRALLAAEPAAREALLRCDEALRAHVEWSLIDRLERGDDVLFDRTEFVQPAIFAMQVALAAAWGARGIVPAAVVGQSIGEVAAAHVAGALSLDDAARVICHSSALIARSASGRGGTAMVGLPVAAMDELLADFGDRLSIAGTSAPQMTIVAGEAQGLEDLLAVVRERGVFGRRVRMDYASHSPHIDALLPEFLRALDGVEARDCPIDFHSTVTGTRLEGHSLDAAYWARNLREPVQLASTLERLAAEGFAVFVEVDPHPVLARPIEQCAAAAGTSAKVVSSALRDESEPERLRDARCELFAAGVSGPIRSASDSSPPLVPFVLSAKSAQALDAQAERLAAHLERNSEGSLRELAWSLATTRDAMTHRLAFPASSKEELVRTLGRVARGDSPVHGERARAGVTRPRVAFVFTGQGAQTPGMGRALHGTWPVFREAFERCLGLFERALDRPLRSVMWAEPDSPEAALLDQTAYTQPALFVLEYALAALWQSWGVRPDLVLGHSIGELVAACVAGVFSLEEGVALVAARGRLMQALPPGGAMASIAASESEVAAAVARHATALSIASINGPEQVVISGAGQVVESVAASFAARGVRTRALRVSHAFHSPLMDPMLEAFAREAASIDYRRPSIPLVSNLSGALADAELGSAEYWVRHVRGAVRFADGAAALHAAGVEVFVELGPRATLLGLLPSCLPDQPELALYASMEREREEPRSMLAALCGVWSRGAYVDWGEVFGGGTRRVPLPTYAWQRTRYWLDRPPSKRRTAIDASADWFYRLEWPEHARCATADSPPRRPGPWLVLGGVRGTSALVRQALIQRGCEHVVVEDPARLADALTRRAQWQGIVYLGGLDAVVDAGASATAVGETTHRVLAPLLALARALGMAEDPPPLWIVTQGACAVDHEAADVRPVQTALWGMGRVFALEHPEAWGGLVDLDPQGDPEASSEASEFESLVDELLAPGDEDQLAFRGGRRHAARLVRALGDGDAATPSIVAEGRYLVTGGLGALGSKLAEWLVERGARHLLLTSRRGLSTPGAREAIASLEARGVRVEVAAIDVADEEAMEALVSGVEPPIRGVIHAAGIEWLGPLAQTDETTLAQVLRPKVVGGWALHRSLARQPLDFFVCFSSGAGVWGGTHRGAYAAANAFLDGLAHHRRAQARPALSIAWGMWAQGGMGGADGLARLRELGVLAMPTAPALLAMEHLLGVGATQRTVARMDWERFAPIYTARARRKLLAALVSTAPEPASDEPPPASGRWHGQSAEDLRPHLIASVREIVAEVLGMDDPGAVDATRGFAAQGLDSLMAVQLRSRLQRALGLTLSTTVAFDHPTVERLVEHVLTEVLALEGGGRAQGLRRGLQDEPIAIIGMSCRFPGGVEDPQAYWQLLAQEEIVIDEVPSSRWRAEDYYDPDPGAKGRTYVTRGGFLREIEGFEPAFFHISPREAETIDPQQRLMLELSWEALERAGQDPRLLRDSATGVFVGVGPNEYAERLAGSLDPASGQYRATGSPLSFTAGRVSFALGLHGPSLAVDTACSSSLVALHLACQSLRQGECERAIAGGVNVLLSPRSFIAMSEIHALSGDGRCKTFSAEADGYGRAEGCGVVVLKRLGDAQRDGDRVLALIRGTAVNHDGPSSGLTVPNGPAQQALLRDALAQADIAPSEIDFVECHGTGTALGDPIEVQALAAVYGEGRPSDRPLVLGAAKANLGHLEPAAGIAGLLKLVLMFEREQIPAQPALGELNPHLDWDALPVTVPRERLAWPRREERPRRGAVSGFGLSGTNAHVVLEEAPVATPTPSAPRRAAELFVLSARTEAGLDAQAQRLREHLGAEPELEPGDLAYSLATTRAVMDHRLAIAAESVDALCVALEDAARGSIPAGGTRARAAKDAMPGVVFVFPGQGSQWAGMGLELLEHETAFREAMVVCDAAIRAEAGFSVIEELGRPEPGSRLDEIDVVQPVLFAFEVALTALWRSWGVEPAVVVGHSMGEVAAAHVAGALTLEDAVAIICRRSRLLRTVSGRGAMALVELPHVDAQRALAGYEQRLSIAVSNGPRSTVIAGDTAALEELLERLEREGTFCRRVKVDVASHSPQMDPLREELLERLGGLRPRRASLRMRSTVRGTWIEGEELSGAYWADNLREPVRFGEAIGALVEGNHRLFLEMSPHPILVPSVQENLRVGEHEGVALGSLRRGREELLTLLESLGTLWAQGHPLDWARRFPAGGRRLMLPTYAWQRERCWIEATPEVTSGLQAHPHRGGHPLLGVACSPSTHPSLRIWETSLDLQRLTWLQDHRVQGAVVLPGTAHVEMALSAGAESFADAHWRVTELVFVEALAFVEGVAPTVQVVLTEEGPGHVRFQISSLVAGAQGSSWRPHARGALRHVLRDEASEPRPPDALEGLRARLGQALSAAEIYAELAAIGLDYGPAFQGIVELWRGGGESLGCVRLPQAAGGASPYLVHPALLDACFQVMAGALVDDGGSGPWIPVHVDAIHLQGPLPDEVWCHARILEGPAGVRGRADLRRADLRLMRSTGEVLAEISGLELQRLADSQPRREEDDWFLALDWEQARTPAAKLDTGRWLVIGNGGGLGASLVRTLQRAGHAVVHALPTALGESPVRTVDDGSVAGFRALLNDAFDQGPPTAVVHLGSLDGQHADAGRSLTPEGVEEALRRGCDSVLFTVQALVTAGLRDTPRLWLVTRGAQAIAEGPVDPGQAPLVGLGRVIALEHAELRCSLVDLPLVDAVEPADDDAAMESLVAELLADDAEQEIALRHGARYVARLAHQPPTPRARPERIEPAGDRPYRLEIDQPGVLERLALRPASRRDPGPEEVEIAVEATGLNFLDVLLALGVMPDDLPGEPGAPMLLGAECAGHIVAKGEGVEEFSLGQPVLALARGSMGSHVTVPTTLVVPRPAELSPIHAAAMPITYLTAWYALDGVARLQPGERVLIHSATGGVGLAAIQWAQHCDAEIHATAGSADKRDHLRSLGITHVSDSRSDRFVDDVLEWSGGRGVDVVLNSLSGELIEKSFGLLRAHGRFVELGKRDYYADRPLGLKPFLRNLSFSLVDLRGMMVERPAMVRELLEELVSLITAGVFQPPPVTTFPISRAADAFHHMAQARHIGKIVLTMGDGEVSVREPATALRPIREDGSYLVTGGLGGLGLSVARHLAERGAGHLVLLGRSGASTPEQREAVASLEAHGTSVTVAAADVADRTALERALQSALHQRPPLRGVIHAAGLLDDAMLPQQDPRRFRAVMAPKVLGALHLHTLTRAMPLDMFVMYSAAAGLLGSPGQSNYAAANCFLDALAHHRVAQGLPALSIDWGAFAEVGLAAAQANRGARLVSRGMRSLSPREGLTALDRLLEHGPAQVGVVPLDVRQWIEFYPAAAASPMLARLVSAHGQGAARTTGDRDVLARLAAAEPRARGALLEQILRAQASQVLRIPEGELDVSAPLTSLGLDSLMGLELRNRIEATLGLTVPATLLWTYPTVSALAMHLAQHDAPAAAPVTTNAASEPSRDPAAEIDQMSDDELTRLIAEEFDALT